MNEEPPSSEIESQRLGITKKAQERLRKIYQNFSYKPKNKQEIAGSIRDSSDRGVLEKGTLSMMEGALKVSTSQVRDIMIPRPQIVFVSSDEDSKEFLPRVIKSRHSRFPVINNETEEVEGLLLAKDLLPLLSRENNENLNLKNLIRPASLVPEGKKLNILLDEFRAKRNHMAIVIDEYGDITGLVTIEDVLEEIVGEIEDEHDDLQDTMIKQVSNNEHLVSALIPIKEFNEEFDSSLEDSEFDTLGGIVMHHFSRFPKINDAISIGDLRFVIASTSKKRIKQIKVLK